MKSFYCVFFVIFPIVCNSQSFNIDASIAIDREMIIPIYNLSPGIGYSFTDNDYVFGGLKFQSYSLIPKYDRDENDLWSTTTILNFMFYAGTRYTIPVIRIKKNTDSEHIIGFFPECRLYFNPYMPRKIKYIDNNDVEVTATGGHAIQLAYGIGFGIYIKEVANSSYFSLRFEYSNIDAFKTLRDLNYGNKHFDFSTNTQFSLGISLFFL